jgi:hypothetical protein
VKEFNASSFADAGQTTLSSFTTSWAAFSATHLDLGFIIESLLGLQGVLFLFDYIYRTFQTARLISKFWRCGVVALPKIDLRTRKAEFQSSRVLTKIGYVLHILPFVYMQLLLVALFIVLITWSIVGMLDFVC